MNTRSRTVLIADPRPLSRAALGAVLTPAGLTVVAEAADAEAAVAAAERHRPGVCIVDDDLPGGAVLAVHRLTARVPETLVVVIAPSVTREAMLAAVRAGARGYLAKTTSAAGLARAVEAMLAGQAAIPRAALAGLIHELRGGGGLRTFVGGVPLSLTERELEVLELLRGGMTTPEIAHELGLSSVTVRRHLGAILGKTGRHARAELLDLVEVA